MRMHLTDNGSCAATAGAIQYSDKSISDFRVNFSFLAMFTTISEEIEKNSLIVNLNFLRTIFYS